MRLVHCNCSVPTPHDPVTITCDWQCQCGNRPDLEGFFPCNRQGEYTEPMPDTWPDDLYKCDRCKRIIVQATGEEFTQSGTASCLTCGEYDCKGHGPDEVGRFDAYDFDKGDQ